MHTWDNNKKLYQDYLTLFEKLNIKSFDAETLNRFDQIHAGGITSTKKIANLIKFQKGQKVLELGGGIGGVARFLAKNYDVSVYNLDLSFSYSLTGFKLGSLIKDRLNVFYINGDANNIPFLNYSFHVVWLQHINMNIHNKKKFFTEIKRVTKPKGVVVFHEWFLSDKSETDLLYPLPWSDNEKYNFLVTFDNFINIAEERGFKLDFSVNDTEEALIFYKKIYENKLFANPIFKNRDGSEIFKNMITLIERKSLEVYYGLLVL
ncbi:MAG: class I SAM-dependent methyltransferase [Proteobacteria bacterium]|nr:class I SAM-dependent methyltransferase [Pseudomonadota bacterium]